MPILIMMKKKGEQEEKGIRGKEEGEKTLHCSISQMQKLRPRAWRSLWESPA